MGSPPPQITKFLPRRSPRVSRRTSMSVFMQSNPRPRELCFECQDVTSEIALGDQSHQPQTARDLVVFAEMIPHGLVILIIS